MEAESDNTHCSCLTLLSINCSTDGSLELRASTRSHRLSSVAFFCVFNAA